MRSTVGHISINKMGTSRFSSDLDMGRRPKLKSDENKEVPILYIEILKCEHFFTVKKVLHLIGASVPDRHRVTSDRWCVTCWVLGVGREGARCGVRAAALFYTPG